MIAGRPTRALLLASVLVPSLFAGCLTPTERVGRAEIPFQTLSRGFESGIHEETTVVVRDQQALVGLWNEHDPNGTAPNVDFQNRMVVGVFKGESPDACHGAEVTGIEGRGDHVLVEAEFFVVDGVACAEQVTYPFEIVETERKDAEVRFEIEQTTRPPGGPGPNESNGSSS